MSKIKKPKFQAIEFNPEKDARSVNIFYYGILLDCLYVNGTKNQNVQIYMCPDNTYFLNFLKFKEKKIQSQFQINIMEISGISDKALKEQHQKIMKKDTNVFYLSLQTNFEQIEQKVKCNEYLFQFDYESTQKVFWQGLKSIIKRQKKQILQLPQNIINLFQQSTTVDQIYKFILERCPYMEQTYLTKLIQKYDIDYQEELFTSQIIELFQEININSELLKAFNSATQIKYPNKNESTMTFQEFQKFQTSVQNDVIYDDIQLLQKLRKINPEHDIRLEKLSFYDFCCILQDENPLLTDYQQPKETQSLNEFFIFNKVFFKDDLQETVKKTIENGCIFFDFEVCDGPKQLPLFKIKSQQQDCFHMLNIFVEHVSTSDLPLLISMNIKCSNEQQVELVEQIENKVHKYIFKDSNLQLGNLKQKIIFMSGNASNKKLQAILCSDYCLYSQQEAQDLVTKNQKSTSDQNRQGLHHIRGKEFPIIDFFQNGFQIINQESLNTDHLLYVAKFQNSLQKFNPLVEKPHFMTQTPYRYPHTDFNKVKQTVNLNIISGFQLGADNVFLDIQLKGIKQDYLQNPVFYSKVVEQGFNPVFNQQVTFDVRCPQLAQVLIYVYEKVYDGADNLISQVAFNVSDMKVGIRKINLRNLEFDWNLKSYLMISSS